MTCPCSSLHRLIQSRLTTLIAQAWSAGIWVTAIWFIGPLLLTGLVSSGNLSGAQWRLPAGFEIQQVADDRLAHDIYCMTLNPAGQIVVSGPGYICTLLDTDGDAVADRARLFSDRPHTGAQGMLFLGNDLLCTGDDQLMLLRDENADGVADGTPESWATLRTREHGAHALRRGPDGGIYVMCGNDAQVNSLLVRSTKSPVNHPQSGTLLRFSPDGRRSEIVAHGFRNAYDFAIDASGQFFTVDSDGERDQHLPWYLPTRLFQIRPGMHHGWVNNGWMLSWARPAEFFDSQIPLATYGRGSPTGLVCYRHRTFPAKYRGGLFHACWSLGRVYFTSLQADGNRYVARPTVFLQPEGDQGFAPVDLAVDPAGDLLVAIGGRGTQGGVFRIRYVGPGQTASRQPVAAPLADAAVQDDAHPVSDGELASVLSAPQPDSSWSRHQWMPRATSMTGPMLQRAVVDRARSDAERIRAIELSVQLGDGLTPSVLRQLVSQASPALLARAGWALGWQPLNREHWRILVRLCASADPQIALAAWEALLRAATDLHAPLRVHVDPHLFVSDRAVRDMVARVLANHPLVTLSRSVPDQDLLALRIQVVQSLAIDDQLGSLALRFADIAETPQPNRLLQREVVRLMQIAVGDVQVSDDSTRGLVGYSPARQGFTTQADRQQATDVLADYFPDREGPLRRETCRLAAMLSAEDARLIELVASSLHDVRSVPDQLHYLMVLAQLRGKRSQQVTTEVATRLVTMHESMEKQGRQPSRNWPLRVRDMFRSLCRRDPQLPEALVAHPQFGRPEHVIFIELLPKALQAKATSELLAQLRDAGEDARWNAETVALLWQSGDRPSWRELQHLWDRDDLRPVLVQQMLEHPDPAYGPFLFDALHSVDVTLVVKVAEALDRLNLKATPQQLAETLAALRIVAGGQRATDRRATELLVGLIQHWTDYDLDVPPEPLSASEFRRYFAPLFDDLRRELGEELPWGLNGRNEDWEHRTEHIDLLSGSAERGQKVFHRLQCAACHEGDQPLGPALDGVTRRLSPADLLLEIVSPNRNVSPDYFTHQIVTDGGRTYIGNIVYQSPDATLVQTGPAQTVRIAGQKIASITRSRRSMMPDGLLNQANDQEIADLFAYLKEHSRD